MYKNCIQSISVDPSDLWEFKKNTLKGDMIEFAKISMSKKFKNKSRKRKKKK